MLPSYFVIQKALQKPSETATILPLLPFNSGFGDAVELLLHVSIVLQSTCISRAFLAIFIL